MNSANKNKNKNKNKNAISKIVKNKPRPKAKGSNSQPVDELVRRLTRGNALSKCCKDYIKSVHAPWNATLACIPMPPCFPSQKVQTWVKGTMSTGSGNFGFVTMAPARMIARDHAVGITAPVWESGSLYAGTTINYVGTGITTVNSNSPFVLTDFSSGQAMYRLVSAGIRLRYIGMAMYAGGTSLALTEPDHESTSGFNTTILLDYPEVHCLGAAQDPKKWISTIWYPIDATDYAYTNDATVGKHCMALAATSVTNSYPGHYEYECYANFEVIGTAAKSRTASMGDSIGGAAALEYFAHNAPVGDVKPTLSQALKGVSDTVKSASGLFQTIRDEFGAVVPYVKSAAQALEII